MESIELNLENLKALGLTKEIFENNFEEWLFDNEDFYIDIDNKKIYIGKVKLKNDIQKLIEIYKNEYVENGNTPEDAEKYLFEIRESLKKRFLNTLEDISEDLRFDFLIHTTSKLEDNVTKLKEEYFSKKLNSIIQLEYHEDVTSEESVNIKSSVNPYPRIFTSNNAYFKFENLLKEFENSRQNLANYSFVFHKMKKDNLIYNDLKQLEFIDFLSTFEIHLDRLKPISQLGNNDLREGIYNRI